MKLTDRPTSLAVPALCGMVLLSVTLVCEPLLAQEGEVETVETENASNPLAKTRNTDLNLQWFDLEDGSDRLATIVEGAFMARDDLKVKYEFHHWHTDVTGDDESGLERASLKGIWFPMEGRRGELGYRLALGLEWIIDGGNSERGIGTGGDQLAPFVGVALAPRPGTTIIPLIQHFESYQGEDVSSTGARVIAMQTLPNQSWLKLDGIVSVDWANDNALPASIEVQLGRKFTSRLSLFCEGLFGIGSDRSYDYGIGVGMRFNY